MNVSRWTLLVPVSFMPTQLFSRASCWRCCSHNNWWGALLHRRVIKLGFAALAANAASQAGSHNAQDTSCPTEHHQVDEDDAKRLASTGPDLRCSYQMLPVFKSSVLNEYLLAHCVDTFRRIHYALHPLPPTFMSRKFRYTLSTKPEVCQCFSEMPSPQFSPRGPHRKGDKTPSFPHLCMECKHRCMLHPRRARTSPVLQRAE